MAVKTDSAVPSKAPTESVQAFSSRFRQSHSELQYAVQSRYKGAISRCITIQEADEEALHIYIANLRNWSNSASLRSQNFSSSTRTTNQSGIMDERKSIQVHDAQKQLYSDTTST